MNKLDRTGAGRRPGILKIPIQKRAALLALCMLMFPLIISAFSYLAITKLQEVALYEHQRVISSVRENLEGPEGEAFLESTERFKKEAVKMATSFKMMVMVLTLMSLIIGLLLTLLVSRTIAVELKENQPYQGPGT